MALPSARGDREYWRFFQDNVAYLNNSGSAVPIGTFVGGQYNLVAPTYTDGDPVVFQFTSSGLLKTDASLTVEGDINIGSVELKDATTDTRAVIKSDGTNNALVVTMNALPTGSNVIGEVTISSLPALTTGTATIGSVKITDGALTLPIATDGAVVKTQGIMIMGTDGTNAQTVSMNSDGDVNIADGGNVITVDGSGSAGTAATGVVTVQGIASMTAIQVADNSGSLTVDLLSEYADDADWSDGSSKHLMVGGLYGTNTITDGDTGPIAVNASGEVKVVQATAANLNVTEASASTISSAVATPTTLTGGSKTVASSGTAEALGTTLATKSIYIRAKSTNTSFVCVGDSNVDESTNQQIILYANDSVTLDIANRLTVYIDADVNTEGVDYVAMS
jgi:hypothetical protein